MNKKKDFKDVQIDFYDNKSDGLLINISTKRLFICPVKLEYLDYYSALFSNSEAMKYYEYGVPFEGNSIIEGRMKDWIKKWSNYNPYSGYSVFDKEKKHFIGHIDIEATEQTNNESVELGYIFVCKYWGNGIATEATSAIVNNLVPLLLENPSIYQYTLREIIATTESSNIASQKVLSKIGFTSDFVSFNRYNKKRYKFHLDTSTINIDDIH